MINSVREGIITGGTNPHVHLLKIPHHGSKSSIQILSALNDSCDIACSTVYRRGNVNLPDSDVMKLYQANADKVYCTGKRCKNDEMDTYGVLKVTTDILENTYCIVTEGNTSLWENEQEL